MRHVSLALRLMLLLSVPFAALAAAAVSLPSVSLHADAPDGAKGQAFMGGADMVSWGQVTLLVGPAKDSDPKTVDDAAAPHGADGSSAIKKEALADGRVLTYTGKPDAKSPYAVMARRTIGGKDFLAATNVQTPEQQAEAVAVVRSLRP